MAHLELCTKAIENSLMKALVGLSIGRSVWTQSSLVDSVHLTHQFLSLSFTQNTALAKGTTVMWLTPEKLHAIYQALVTEHNIWLYQTLHCSHSIRETQKITLFSSLTVKVQMHCNYLLWVIIHHFPLLKVYEHSTELAVVLQQRLH